MHLYLEQHSSLFTNPPPMYLLEIPWFYHKLHALSICTFIYPPNKIKPLFFLILPHLPKEKFFFRGIYLCRDFILLTCSKIWCTALFRFLYLWRSTSQRRLIPFNMTVLFVYKFIQFLKQKKKHANFLWNCSPTNEFLLPGKPAKRICLHFFYLNALGREFQFCNSVYFNISFYIM